MTLLYSFITLFIYLPMILADFCGENKIPYGLEVYANGRASLQCSRPICFKKHYSDCEERAFKDSCPSKSAWVGGITSINPLLKNAFHVQCCEFEQLQNASVPLHRNMVISPGEYFEGEEVMDDLGLELTAFDVITDLKQIRHPNKT
uniref:Activin_recp domain-containing protein n=1 Tax=Rhabditophanes sp. KR3021 TaxID=114890 RepID=A0AC35TLE8_9BILA